MKRLSALMLAALLAGCGDPTPTAPTTPAAPTDTVESLVADPERLKVLREQCRANRAKVGEELCNRVGEATRKRFMGDGKVPYTPPAEPPKF